MAIEAKISLMNKTEKAISSSVPADYMNTMLTAMADVLQGFEVKEIVRPEDCPEDLLTCYLDALRVQGRSAKTIEHYERTIRSLQRFVHIPTRQITVHHIRGWLAEEQKRGISDVTRNGNRQVFSAYFNWLHKEGLIEHNPMGNITAIKCQKKQKKIYTPVDIEKLKAHCSEQKHELRNRAIVAFLKSTGCRISEVTGLNRDAVNLQTLEVVVLGKGNKERKVYLDEIAGMALKEYLEHRMDDNPALFVNHSFERLTNGGVRAMLKDLATLANVEHVHPHKFRRTLATNLQRRGMPIQEVAHILGHEKLDTTLKYTVLNDDDVKNDYRKYTV